ncbi:MAG TPA: hypothetical protein GXZ98_03315 [Firmicutes bacterium]|jgi:hypothetical protein|nr:hypothetical protein [Bacillota bacterium]
MPVTAALNEVVFTKKFKSPENTIRPRLGDAGQGSLRSGVTRNERQDVFSG